MRTKKEFYEEINGITVGAMKTIQNLIAQLNEVEAQISSGIYSAEHIRRELFTKKDVLKGKIRDTREKAEKAAKEVCDEYVQELRDQEELDPALLTDDVRLLQAGVKLNERDAKAMLRRNAGNQTMTQLILRYCKENDIETGVYYYGNKPIIDVVGAVPTAVKTSLRWSDQENVYDRLVGEGSEVERYFNVNEGSDNE